MAVLTYVAKFSESGAAHHFEIPHTTLRGWKGLDKQPTERAGLLTKKQVIRVQKLVGLSLKRVNESAAVRNNL